MTKLSRKAIPRERFSDYINSLWSAFTLMDSKEDIRLLFKDLFTHTEYKMFAKRLEIARRLEEGQTYEQIGEELHVTTHTIGRVSNTLNVNGEGLRKVIAKLQLVEQRDRNMNVQRRKRLENPFYGKTQRKSLGGELLKLGLHSADAKIKRSIKVNSAKRKLDL